ncbi:peptidase C26 [Oceanimonas sp. GK1]|jgi:putative glutamine amidotransferase|uniref:gamma-glutamyl-gamma-aminobutyrate hydrolase family protein n=1 Tax=Oceanimonas sp. (strain GK1 / IBRC-M 10197) TaxID=511062 RepID=UPI00024951ED|nr:type 1 glutamine amidotransferase [Oceanimonas sp. GK1]AEY00901.1 peptidase C26 [Oceanimonas sp. GK1]
MAALIGVTGPNSRLPLAWWASRLALHLAGGRGLHLTPANMHRHRRDQLQGLIIGGGDDIDAALYGHDTGRAPADPERDAFEIELIEHALDTSLPLLGICRGAQLINVVLGGSLHADIRPQRLHTSNRRTPLPRKTAIGCGNGRLSHIMQQPRWRINSLHHQAVDRLGGGLAVVARDLDGFVQAIESTTDHYLLGVQWHPEYLPYLSCQRRLFQHLVQAAEQSWPEALYD